MRASHIERRLEQQLFLKDLIAKSFDNLTRCESTEVTPQRVRTRLSDLKENWEKFSLVHDAINISIKELASEDRFRIRNHSYFSENTFSVTHEHYLQSVERMSSLIESEPDNSPNLSFGLSVSQPPRTVSTFFHHARLPRIEIPKFNGIPSEWLPFKDLFISLVVANPTLSAVEKLQYLKTSVTGSAAHLLKNTTLIAENFPKARDSLISFYENQRLLVNAAMHSLLSLKRMSKESSTELEQLYSSITQIYRTFETLRRPVDKWDDFIVFITVQRLDSESVKAWENHLGAAKEPPSWNKFSEFLLSRLLSLQAFEKSRGGKLGAQQQVTMKSHYQGRKNSSNSPASCTICSSDHYVASCPQYSQKSVQQRLELIAKHKLCYNCLGKHRVSTCRITKRCFKCGHRHHTTIHQNNNKPVVDKKNAVQDTSKVASVKLSQTNVLHSSLERKTTTSSVLLATAQVIVTSSNGENVKARALIDQGSEISLISERLVQLLRLPRKRSFISLVGIGAHKTNQIKGVTSINLKSLYNFGFQHSVSVYILPKLTASIPSVEITNPSWPHLKGLTLADPDFGSPGAIDLILGAEVYGQIIEQGVIKGVLNSPIAQHTKFGWMISGPTNSILFPQSPQSYHVTMDRELHDSLSRFWNLEEVSIQDASVLPSEHQECENHFKSTHSRDNKGRYIVRLPFKGPKEDLGESRLKALRIVTSISRRMSTNPVYALAYSEFLAEYENLGHMRQVPQFQPEPKHVFYLPHHGVLREQSLTTKLRVVFNGSSCTTSGVSLNELLHTGGKLQVDIFDVLIWFRQFRYVFSSDVEKMYRQINVHPEDWDFQRILWINQSNELTTYQLTTVTYGLACAPFLALRTFLQLVEDEGKRFPLAVSPLKKGRYVDDIFGGADTIEQAQAIVAQLDQICMAGGFPLKKWISSHAEVLLPIPLENQIYASMVDIKEDTTFKTLGMCWQPSTDYFLFTFTCPASQVFTKRSVLSAIAKLFDPLGLLAPIIIKAKIFIQELWSVKLDWDDPLPDQLTNKWKKYIQDLQDTPKLKFPRWLEIKSDHQMEVHGFCDASTNAYAAAVYIRTSNSEGLIRSNLLSSKSKVAPLKRLTIPRLELSGAVLLTRLVKHVLEVLEFLDIPIYLWTDSAITYTWLNNHPSRWKDFVHNRVCFVQENLPQAIWRFVPGKENPADLATRGLTPAQLAEYSFWWNGPQWLIQSPSTWPKEPQLPSKGDNLEERSVHITTINVEKPRQLWELIHRYSSLNRLLRITATCFRTIAVFKRNGRSTLSCPITAKELECARFFWVKAVQQSSFHQEVKIISKGNSLTNSSPLLRLTPFLDHNGLLRSGGRLQFSSLPSDSKHPFIMPKDSPLTRLIISDAHLRSLHGGTQTTLALIRNEFWILSGRSVVKSHILKCIRCTRYRQKRAQQLMGQLPPERVTPSRPFLHSGIDYAGPLTLKTWKGRGHRTYKGYIALFVCLVTSAIHLELVTDYSADAFIAAYKRFTSRRGLCASLKSDCGTNFKGADAELQKLFSLSSKELGLLASVLAKDGTQWEFNPPGAPHFGGKWEAGVKSVKYHLRRVIGDSVLTYEEMMTLLIQIEAVLNSRPLSPLNDDPEDLEALTPGHFLTGSAISTVPEPSLNDVKKSHLSRWQLIRQMLSSFWTRWSTECLQRYQATYKWNRSALPISIGSLVLVIDERYPPSKWPLGRVIQTHPGKDGLTRVVTVRTQVTTLKRPIVKLCPLVSDSESVTV